MISNDVAVVAPVGRGERQNGRVLDDDDLNRLSAGDWTVFAEPVDATAR